MSNLLHFCKIATVNVDLFNSLQFPVQWVPDGRRLITGAASGEFTLWNGINLNFESILQVIMV